MAQAARLNLRMQKELKLLLTDPPPGAAFPNLDLSSSVSLTTIDALIDGPEGTVYEKGVFKIKIQIPERYPFQPPIVTFNTPIYHPNIDTGGRICLDILNLPPKGAWQPSLNISTVLTSIGLLLSEPNPDDGLMCEASKEYKYNKQVFDQKARSMTEKYAKSDASPNHGGHQFVTDSVVTEDKAQEPVKSDMHECSVGFRKISGDGRKLSLEPSSSHTKENDADMNNARSSAIPDQGRHQFITESSMTEDRAPELAKTDMHEYVVGSEKLPRIGRKLSLDALGSKTRESMGVNEVPSYNLSCQSQIHEPKRDSKDMSFDNIKSNVLTTVNSDHYQDNKPPAISSKKLCLSGKNLQHKVSVSSKKPDVVDKKAISMTLKCAKSDASSDDGVNQFLADSSTTGDKPLELVKTNMHEYAVGLKQIPRISRKLSLNALGSNIRESEMGMNEAPLNTVNSQSQIQEPKQDLKGTALLHQQLDQDKKAPAFSSTKLRLSGKNLQLDSAKRTNDTMPPGPQKENMLRISDTKAHSDQEVQKLTGNSRKLSLNNLGSNTKESEMGMNEAPLNTVNSQLQIQQPKQDLKGSTFLHQQLDQDKKAPAFNSKKLCLSGKKLQREVLDSAKRTNDTMPPGPQKENMLCISDTKAHSDQEVQKLTGNSKKLSLSSLGSNTKESEMGMNEAPLNTVSSQSQIQQPKQDLKGSTLFHQQLDQDKKAPAFNSKKLRLSGKRTNGTMPPVPQKENVLLISEATAHSDQEVHKESTKKSCFGNPKRKKLGLTGMKPSSGFLSLAQNKENNDEVHTGSDGSNMSKKTQTHHGEEKHNKNMNLRVDAENSASKLSRKPLQSLEEKNNNNMKLRVDAETVNTSASKHHGEESEKDILEQGVCDSEGVIVLDSEDSDEERRVRSSSRRLIGRKRLLGKC